MSSQTTQSVAPPAVSPPAQQTPTSGNAQGSVGNQEVQNRRLRGGEDTDGGDPNRHTATTPASCASAADFGGIVRKPEILDTEVLSAMAALQKNNPTDVGVVVANASLMKKTLTKLGLRYGALGLLQFQFGASEAGTRTLKHAVKWLVDTVGLDVATWGQLVAGRGGQALAEVVGWRQTFDAVRALPGDPLTLMPGLSMDPHMLGHVVSTYPYLLEWVEERGGSARVNDVMAHIQGQQAADAIRSSMTALGKWDAYLAALPDGPATDAATKRNLYYFLMSSPDNAQAEWNTLFKKRFNLQLNFGPADESLTRDSSGSALENPDRVPWDKPSLIRSWQILDMTPAQDVAASQRVIREGASGQPTGWAAENSDEYDQDADGVSETRGARNGEREIGMSWGTGAMGMTEIGAYTDDMDPMRGLNIFDSCFRHELGHNVADREGYDTPTGFVSTQFGWKEHKGDDFKKLLTDVILVNRPLVLESVPEAQRQNLKNQIIQAIADCDTHKPSAYRAAVDGIQAGLWEKVAAEPFGQFLNARSVDKAWDRQMLLGDRSYHVSYDWAGWVSCTAERYAAKPSRYAMRSPWEWFAECYATFYEEADMVGQPLGHLLSERDPKAAEVFIQKVHGRHNLAKETGQGTVGVAPASAPKPEMGDFPTRPRSNSAHA